MPQDDEAQRCSEVGSKDLSWILNVNYIMAIILHIVHNLLQNLLRKQNRMHVVQRRRPLRINIHIVIV